MIRLRELTKSYRTSQGRHYVFRRLSFEFPEGCNVGLIGPNGAGKSTLMRIIGGIEAPDSGSVITNKRISFPVGLSGGFQGSLSGRDNAKFVCRLYGNGPDEVRDKIAFVESFADLGKYFDEPIRKYSSGMRARLVFGLSMAFDFDYYLMDEVSAVGDASFKKKSVQLLEEKIGKANVIYVAHSMNVIRRHCDRVVLLRDGQARLFDDVEHGIAAYQAELENVRSSRTRRRRLRRKEGCPAVEGLLSENLAMGVPFGSSMHNQPAFKERESASRSRSAVSENDATRTRRSSANGGRKRGNGTRSSSEMVALVDALDTATGDAVNETRILRKNGTAKRNAGSGSQAATRQRKRRNDAVDDGGMNTAGTEASLTFTSSPIRSDGNSVVARKKRKRRVVPMLVAPRIPIDESANNGADPDVAQFEAQRKARPRSRRQITDSIPSVAENANRSDNQSVRRTRRRRRINAPETVVSKSGETLLSACASGENSRRKNEAKRETAGRKRRASAGNQASLIEPSGLTVGDALEADSSAQRVSQKKVTRRLTPRKQGSAPNLVHTQQSAAPDHS